MALITMIVKQDSTNSMSFMESMAELKERLASSDKILIGCIPFPAG
jgi:hypothetical protein